MGIRVTITSQPLALTKTLTPTITITIIITMKDPAPRDERLSAQLTTTAKLKLGRGDVGDAARACTIALALLDRTRG